MNKEAKEQRQKLIFMVMDELDKELVETFENLQEQHPNNVVAELFVIEAKAKIYHWLTVLVDQIENRENMLEFALELSQEMIQRLKAKKACPPPKEE